MTTIGSGGASSQTGNGALPGGSYIVSATYAGDTNVAGSTSTSHVAFAVAVKPVFTNGNSAGATVGHTCCFQVSATGTPTPTFAMSGALPDGVSFNTSTGQFSGSPHRGSAGSSTFTITATKLAGSVSQTFHLSVSAP